MNFNQDILLQLPYTVYGTIFLPQQLIYHTRCIDL